MFLFVGTIPKTDFLKGSGLTMDARGYVPTTELLETNVPGVFCAGDARVKYLRQVVTAAADGAVAAVAAEKYIHEEETFRESVLEPELPVMVAFWSPTSQASLDFLPAVERIARERKGQLEFVKIDIYKNQRVAKRYGIEQAPTIAFFRGGELVEKAPWPTTEQDLELQANRI